MPQDAATLTPEATRKLLYELQVHQIELEMQNEELRRAQAELDAARTRYFDLYDLAPVGYVSVSEKGLILEANLTAAKMLGMARGALSKQLLTRFIHKEDQDIYYLHRKQIFEPHSPSSGQANGTLACELRMKKKDGKAFWAQLEAALAHDINGAAICRVVLSDISERKQAESQREAALEALRLSEEKFATAFRSASYALTITRASDEKIIEVNDGFLAISGYSFADVAGKTTFELKLWDNESDRDLIVAELLKGNKIAGLEISFKKKSGELIVGLFSAEIIIIQNEKCILSSITDITDRKLAESQKEAALEAVRAKSEELERFTYSVSHDLKSPLVTIRTFLGILEQDMDANDKEKVKQDIGYIRSGAEKMSRLLDELLDLARIGRSPCPAEALSLQSIVKEARDLVAGRIAKRGVEVKVSSADIVLHGERTRLVEVFQNLLDNACKFMGEQKSPLIEIGVESKDDEAVIYVRDNGSGISPQFLPKIFIMFEKQSRGTEGDGIGLALVKRIVDVHGGRIWVESDGPGHGACFKFTLAKEVRSSELGVRSEE
jgi:PAS domain S-box-containing protein